MNDSQKAINSDTGGIKTRWIIVTIFLIVLIVLVLYFVNFPHHLSDKNEVWGTFGDYVGGILNPVIAAFAFYLIAKSYELQKTELEATRKLLETSTKAQEDQIKLAALTSLLNSNLVEIGFLENKKDRYKEIPKEDIESIVDKLKEIDESIAINYSYQQSVIDELCYADERFNRKYKEGADIEINVKRILETGGFFLNINGLGGDYPENSVAVNIAQQIEEEFPDYQHNDKFKKKLTSKCFMNKNFNPTGYQYGTNLKEAVCIYLNISQLRDKNNNINKEIEEFLMPKNKN